MEDSSQEEKQNFLRTNILEKGYDVNQFVAFLQSKKGEAGSDISKWSMDDLQEVVREFIFKAKLLSNPHLDPNQLMDSSQEINNVPPSTTVTNPVSDINQIPITLSDEDFGIVVPEYLDCLKSETTELSKYDNIQITVTEPKKVDNGFFSKAYINFLITTSPINANVRRKHADFVWLRERLSIIFNLNVLPRLPKKGKVNEDKKINKRMRNLEKFLVYLAKDPLVKNSNIFYDFLTIDKDADFEKRKKIYNKSKTPVEIKDIKSIDGKLKISVTKNKERFLDNIRDNSAFNETALKKFNQNFKLLKTEMNAAISRVLSFTPLFDKLIKISTTYLDNNVIIESYNQMKNIFNTWANTLKKQNSFFLHDVKEYLKFISGNYHHMRELVTYVETIKSNYNKVSKNLINKKTELFRKQDISGWQLDINDKNNIKEFYSDRLASYKKICFKETNNTIKLKEKYGYHLNKMISEYKRLRNINTIEHKEKVIQFAQKESQISSDYFKTMGEIIGIIENCVLKINKEENDIEQNAHNNTEKIPENNEEKEKEENQNTINTDMSENKIEEIIEDKKEEIKEIKNEIKEEKIEENKPEEKPQEEIKDEKNKEEEKKEIKNDEEKEAKEEEKKNENQEKADKPKIEDKKEEIEEKKEEPIEEKKEEIIEEKKEELPEEKKEE